MQIQDHILANAAATNLQVAVEFKWRRQTQDQKVMLQAALILAGLAKERALVKQIKSDLAAVPETAVALSTLHTKLLAVVDQLGDQYGSHATEVGQVFETSADSIDTAIGQCLGGEYTQVLQLPFSQFKKIGRGRTHNKFIKLVEPCNPVCAQTGDFDFSPKSSSPGYFQYCLLVKQNAAAGKNLLVAFPCAMS